MTSHRSTYDNDFQFDEILFRPRCCQRQEWGSLSSLVHFAPTQQGKISSIFFVRALAYGFWVYLGISIYGLAGYPLLFFVDSNPEWRSTRNITRKWVRLLPLVRFAISNARGDSNCDFTSRRITVDHPTFVRYCWKIKNSSTLVKNGPKKMRKILIALDEMFNVAR